MLKRDNLKNCYDDLNKHIDTHVLDLNSLEILCYKCNFRLCFDGAQSNFIAPRHKNEHVIAHCKTDHDKYGTDDVGYSPELELNITFE